VSTAKPKDLLKNLGLLTVSILVSLVIAECLVRFFYPQQLAVWHTTPDGLVIHPPGLVTYLAEFNQEVRFNSIGMRDREHATNKAEGTRRVLVLGDSFMEALQVSFEESFPHRLETRLRETLGPHVDVINCSVSGWGQDAQLAYLLKYGRDLKPDLILVAMTLHNDVFDNMQGRFFSMAQGRLVPVSAPHMSDREYNTLRIKGYFASRSHLWQLVRKWKNLGEIREVASALDKHVLHVVQGGDEPADLQRGWQVTAELLKRIRDTGETLGAETAVMLIPLRYQLEPDSLRKFREAAGVITTSAVIDRPQQLMRTLGREAGLEIIDLLPAFQSQMSHEHTSKGSSLHLQEGHWSAMGHRLATNIAAEEILERQRLKVSLSPGGKRVAAPSN
jgi:hypothetical protein